MLTNQRPQSNLQKLVKLKSKCGTDTAYHEERVQDGAYE